MTGRKSPTVRRRRLADELKELRRISGKGRDEVAAYVGVAPSTVTKIENASAAARPADVAMLLTLYGVEGVKREALMTLAREARQRSWWQAYSGAVPQWFEVYVGLEEEATEIRTFHPEMIDGRLQTETYMRALVNAEVRVPPEQEVDHRVAVRLQRQKRLLSADDPPRLWTIIGEAALHRTIGGTDGMREQLQHLIQMSHLNNITLQVLPYRAGAHPSMQGGFHLLRFDAYHDVVYLEYRQGAIYLEKDADVTAYVDLLDHLVARAFGPDESRALITRAIEGLS